MNKNSPGEHKVTIGLIGLGNIGTGVAKFFHSDQGREYNIHLKKVAVSNLTRPRDFTPPGLTGNADEIIQDPEISIVVELMGGIEPALSYLKKAIGNSKNIVTANKAVMAAHGFELFNEIRARGLDLGFEASVGGGIPIIAILNRYKAEKIHALEGVLNGTCNYILTQMELGQNFAAALKSAQEKGFAEANHSLDTGGFDTRDKLAILASLIGNTRIDPGLVECNGITEITPVDIDFAGQYQKGDGGPGFTVKLVAKFLRKNSLLELSVNPTLMKKDNPLGLIKNEVNGITITGQMLGTATYLGKGAGANPTSAAVISDIIHIAENIRKNISDVTPALQNKIACIPVGEIEKKGYFRFDLLQKPGNVQKISNLLASQCIEMCEVFQQRHFAYTTNLGTVIPTIITVDAAKTAQIHKVLESASKDPLLHAKPFFMCISS